MSSSRDDERYLDDLLADARNAPTPEDLQRLEHRLRDWVGPPSHPHHQDAGSPTAPASGVARRVRSSRLSKPILAVLGVGIMALVYVEASSTSGSSSSPAGGTPIAAPHEIATTSPAPNAPAAPPASPALPPASVSVSDLPEARESAPARPVPVTAPSGAARGPAAGPAATAAAEQESEASFLRRTRATLGGDPAKALRMTEEHGSRYPQGVLVQERDVIAIDALVRLGRRDEARARASAFRTRYPASAHTSRVEAIVGTEGP